MIIIGIPLNFILGISTLIMFYLYFYFFLVLSIVFYSFFINLTMFPFLFILHTIEPLLSLLYFYPNLIIDQFNVFHFLLVKQHLLIIFISLINRYFPLPELIPYLLGALRTYELVKAFVFYIAKVLVYYSQVVSHHGIVSNIP